MKKVAVIFGGSSTERDVSLHTGLAVVESIKDKYDVKSIDISDDYSNLNEKLIDIDLVFIALHGGFGENGTIQKYFEKHNIKFTGSDSKSSSIAMDKEISKKIFLKNKILTPKHIKYDFNKKNKNITLQIQKKLKFPVVIKPINEGSSVNVFICNSNNITKNIIKL